MKRQSFVCFGLPGSLVAALPFFLLVFVPGCASLQLTPIKMTQQKPSNVAVYFKVHTASHQPVSGLTAEQFRIYEDGQLVSPSESKQTVLNPESAAAHYALLLVDMSGGETANPNGNEVADGVSIFVEHLDKQQKVGIYVFDGSPVLHPIAPFADPAGNLKGRARELASFKPKDPNTDRNGAIVKALDELDEALGKATQPMKFGTLVVFTQGPDRANRVSTDTMTQHVREKPFDVFAIGLGADIKELQLREIGKSGTAIAGDKVTLVKAFDDIGAKVETRTKSYYLLSYCSPARAGKHELKIEAVATNPKGTREDTGSLRSDFDATGFGPGCDPRSPPSFDVPKGDASTPSPVADAKERDAKKEEGKKEEVKKEDAKKEDVKKEDAKKEDVRKPEKRAEKKQAPKLASPPAAKPPASPPPAAASSAPAPSPPAQDFIP